MFRRGIAAAALLLAGCASTGGPPDTAADIGAAAGKAAAAVLDQLPVVNTALGAVDEARAKLADLRERRAGAAASARIDDRRWEQCRQNPCLYADRCLELFPDEFMVPDCGTDPTDRGAGPHGDAPTSQATGDPGAAAAPTLEEQLMAAEELRLEPYADAGGKPHVCYGHLILPTDDFVYPLTPEQCRDLLRADIAKHRTEAVRVFGSGSDPLTELCYWRACARHFGRLRGRELAASVLVHPETAGKDPVRALRLATAIAAESD